jgi:hypothetical protein
MPPDGVNTKLILTNTLLDTLSTTGAEIDSNTAELVIAAAAAAEAFATLSGFLQLAIGTFSEAEVGTVLYELRQIKNCICQLANGAEPVGSSPNGCDTPIPSLTDRLVSDDDFPGRGFIEWDATLPQGAELSSDVYPELPSGIEVHLTASSIYYVWVQSTCPAFKLTPDDTSTYPTNQWVPVFGPGTIALSLAADCVGKAFLCIDPTVTFVDCVERGSLLDSVVFTDDTDTEFPGTPQYIPLDGIGGTTNLLLEWDSNSLAVEAEWHILYADVFNWSFQKISGDAMHVGFIWSEDDDDHHETWGSSGDDHTFTCTHHTTAIIIDNAVGGPGDPEGTFVCRICPPEPG